MIEKDTYNVDIYSLRLFNLVLIFQKTCNINAALTKPRVNEIYETIKTSLYTLVVIVLSQVLMDAKTVVLFTFFVKNKGQVNILVT